MEKDLLEKQVSSAIMDYVFRNGLKSGDKLPSERQLANEFEIGRNSVRSGIKILEKNGYLEIKNRDGAYLKKDIDSCLLNLGIIKTDFFEIIEIRMHLESLAIKNVIRIATKKQKDILDNIADKMMNLYKNNKYSITLDNEFHKTILEFSENKTLEILINNLLESLNCLQNHLENANEIWLKTVPFHKDLTVAILNDNYDLAIAALTYIQKIDMEILKKNKR